VHVAKITQLKTCTNYFLRKTASSKSARKADRHRSQNNIKMDLENVQRC